MPGPQVALVLLARRGQVPAQRIQQRIRHHRPSGVPTLPIQHLDLPAVEVHVPAAVAEARSTTFLDGLGAAIAAHTEQQRSCL